MDVEEKQEQSFFEVFRSRMAAKHIGVHHLEKGTGIPRDFLEALASGEFDRLPAAPYVRGYLRQIAPIIDFDPDELWHLYQKQAAPKSAGLSDRLPANRFAIPKRKPKQLLFLFVIAVLVIVYLVVNGSRLIGQPFLELTGLETETTTSIVPSIILSGAIDPDDTLTINNEIVEIDSNGNFERNYPLEPGFNSVTFRVKRFLGRELEIVRHIFYEPEKDFEAPTISQPVPF